MLSLPPVAHVLKRLRFAFESDGVRVGLRLLSGAVAVGRNVLQEGAFIKEVLLLLTITLGTAER